MDKKPSAPEDQELPRLRPEIKAYPQIYDGQPYWVLKDPLALRYYRFDREEYFILEQLRHGVTLRQLKQAHRNEFKSDLLTNAEVAQFISTLTSKNLLLMQQPQRDELLYQAARKRWRAKIMNYIKSYMFLKIPLYDPDKLFDRMIPHLRFIWTWTFFLCYTAVMACALLLVLRRWGDFHDMFNHRFFTLYNIPLLILAMWLVKALHEFGHGLTCKNYGGEVHELGFLILVFNPFLYCNITDAWTFPGKRQRILVTAAGIMTELLIAALATLLWYFTQPGGFIHTLMFNIMVACSISTVMFNANPLLKFDGYYILMDVIEVPNLRQRSAIFLKNLFVRYILGGRPQDTDEEHRFHLIFPIYSVAAFIYRWFILFVILYFVYTMLEQLRLVWLGRFLVVASALTMMIIPLTRGGMMIARQRTALGISNIRLLILLTLLLSAGAAALFWPLQQHITLNFILEPTRMHWLRTDVAGQLSWAPQVHEGAWIDVGSDGSAVVAHLQNPEVLCESKKLSAQIEQVKIDIAQRQKRADTLQLEQFRDRLATLLRDKQRLQEQIADLEVTIPFAGKVLSSDVQLKAMRGTYLLRGAPLFLLADTRQLAAKVWVPENAVARIFKRPDQLNQHAELMLYGFPKDKFQGKVAAIGAHREDNMGQFGEKLALSNKVGGEVLTEYDHLTEQEKPIEAVYEVTIKLDQDSMPPSARPYMSGRTRIDCGRYTLYQWGRDSLLRFISPEVRL